MDTFIFVHLVNDMYCVCEHNPKLFNTHYHDNKPHNWTIYLYGLILIPLPFFVCTVCMHNSMCAILFSKWSLLHVVCWILSCSPPSPALLGRLASVQQHTGFWSTNIAKNSTATTQTLLESLDKLRPYSDHSPWHVYVWILQDPCMLYL